MSEGRGEECKRLSRTWQKRLDYLPLVFNTSFGESMESGILKALSLRDTLSSLSLEPKKTEEAKLTEKILIHGLPPKLLRQIRSLPPKLLHLEVAFKIGKQMGGLHEDSINNRV
ncbi:hypothetical protein FNV43_RR13371 [Rhamnella rubrinervis]|uniref:Uncharacterized protein n=1 Tax=Rhamnella rubrinervis TaxID=2594499 RepID=A0A8K0H0X8_9ROSA|nr:hypothetical protein FNV43_RR13371 [Rhamnella rubrinervis]